MNLVFFPHYCNVIDPAQRPLAVGAFKHSSWQVRTIRHRYRVTPAHAALIASFLYGEVAND